VCRFLLAAIPENTDLIDLERAIPERLRRSLLRVGTRASGLGANLIGFTIVENLSVQTQMPTSDLLVRLTRLPCDCWSTLFTPELAEKESSKWLAVFGVILAEVGRFGVLAHFGDPENQFEVSGPCSLSLANKSLGGLQEDTFYEVCV